MKSANFLTLTIGLAIGPAVGLTIDLTSLPVGLAGQRRTNLDKPAQPILIKLGNVSQ